MSTKTILTHTLLDSLYYSNAYQLLEKKYQGVGVIFTLHHIAKADESSLFNLNRILEITPEFLEKTIQLVLSLDYDIISLDEAQKRLINRDFKRKFACFTFDDGYVDNYQYAFPIFKKYNLPFTIYVTTGIIEGTAILWWRCLEKIILQEECIEIEMYHEGSRFITQSLRQKKYAFNTIYWYLRQMPLNKQQTKMLTLLNKYNISPEKLCLDCAMSWDMLKEIVQSPLVTIGTHTVNHLALAKLSPEQVKEEATQCRDVLSAHLQIDANHFCYPYGDAASANIREFEIIEALGFKTATTTRKAVLFEDQGQQLYSLPRIPLNGHYQQERYVRLFLSGVPTGLWQKGKRVVRTVKSIYTQRVSTNQIHQ